DLYSLGIMLYEMVAGRVPFKAETPFAIALKHLSAPMPPPATFNPRIGPAIEVVVLKAVARATADRSASREQVVDALSAAISQPQDVQARAPIVTPPVEQPTDHSAPTLPVAPVSETAPTMAVLPKTTPMAAKTQPVAPATPRPTAPRPTAAAPS